MAFQFKPLAARSSDDSFLSVLTSSIGSGSADTENFSIESYPAEDSTYLTPPPTQARNSRTNSFELSDVDSSIISEHDGSEFRSGERYEANEARLFRLKTKIDGIDVYPVTYSHPACPYMVAVVSSISIFIIGWNWMNVQLHDDIILPKKRNFDDSTEPLSIVTGGTWNIILTLITAISVHSFGAYLTIFVGNKYMICVLSFLNVVSGMLFASSSFFNLLKAAKIFSVLSYYISMPVAICYVVECSPPGLRATFIAALFVADAMGRFSCCLLWYWIVSHELYNYWLLIPASAGIFACIQAVIIYPLPKCPDYLVSCGDDQAAEVAMQCLRRVPFVMGKLALIRVQVDSQNNSNANYRISRIWYIKNVRIAVMIGVLLTLLMVATKVNIINYNLRFVLQDSNDIYHTVKIEGLKLCFQFFALYTNEYLGTRMCLISGYGLTLFSYSVYFFSLEILKMELPASIHFSSMDSENSCSKHVSCFECLRDVNCGFCYMLTNTTKQVVAGFCTSVENTEFSLSGPELCNDNNYLIKTDGCPHNTSLLIYTYIVVSHLMASMFGIKGITLSYIGEITPTWARILSLYLVTFIDNFGIWLLLSKKFDVHDTNYFDVIFSLLAIFFIYFFVKETRGRPLEYCDTLTMSRKERQREVARRDRIIDMWQKQKQL